MNSNEVLEDILKETNKINSMYVNLHGYAFNQKIGQKLDYKSIIETLEILKGGLESIEFRIEINNFSNDKKKYELVKELKNFTSVLSSRILLFEEIAKKLHKKSENFLKYSIFSYNRDVKKLGKLENTSEKIGEKLHKEIEKLKI